MANPQCEDGFTRISNELIDEAFSKHRITGEAWLVLWVILRKTYGWEKKEDYIPSSQFSKITGLSRQNVFRALKWLNERNIIQKSHGHINQYRFNKDYETWIALKGECKNIALKGESKVDSPLITDVLKGECKMDSKVTHSKEKKEPIQKKGIKKGKFENQETENIYRESQYQYLKSTLPSWMTDEQIQLWQEFIQDQHEKKKHCTANRKKRLLAQLEVYHTEGHDITAIMTHTIKGGYPDFYRPKQNTPKKQPLLDESRPEKFKGWE